MMVVVLCFCFKQIRLRFAPTFQKRFHSTYLPFVAREQGWSRDETLASLAKKAGFSGVVDGAVRAAMRLERYQALKVDATFDEWRAARARPAGGEQAAAAAASGAQ